MLPIAAGYSIVAAPATSPHAAAVTVGQRAADDALQHLIDEVMGLRLVTGQTISMLLAESIEGERALRESVLAGHRQSPTRRLACGDAEVDAWLPKEGLAAALREITTRCLSESDGKEPVLSEAVGAVVVATGRYQDDGRPRDGGPGWRHCDAGQIALATAAAQIDARANLLGRISRLRLPGLQTLGDLLHGYPRFREAVHERIDHVAVGDPVFEPTGVCRRTMSLGRAELIRLLARAATESAERIRADFSRLTDPGFEDPLTVEGFSVVPPVDSPGGGTIWAAAGTGPGWADQFLTAKAAGRGPADAGDERTRRELAARAAGIEARRQLWMKIEALPLPSGGTIGALLRSAPRAVEAFAAVDGAMFPTGAPVFGGDGTAAVTVGIQLQTVWHIARDLQLR